jgi:hypothetical protein
VREDHHGGTYGSGPPHVRMHPPDASARTCDHCFRELPPGRVLVAVAPDSSVVHRSDPSLDGWRLVRACAEHLTELIDTARAGWVEEQLWFGRLARASSAQEMHGAPLRQVARQASLSPERLHQALRWNAWRTEPTRQLPGGQLVPLADTSLSWHGPTVAAAHHG